MVAALVMEAVAFWPVWRWYWRRIGESPEEAWALAAFATALFVLWTSPVRRGSLAPAALGLCVYAASYAMLSPVFRAALASLIVGATFWSSREVRAKAGVVALLIMSTPAMASLEFAAGFPLRVAAAESSAVLIRAAGFAVEPDGTMLRFGEQLVEVDAPCSGVRMLWASLYLVFVLAAVRGLSWSRTAAITAAALAATIASNAMRASSLFFLETGAVDLPAFAHTGAGVVSFVLSAVVLIGVLRSLP